MEKYEVIRFSYSRCPKCGSLKKGWYQVCDNCGSDMKNKRTSIDIRDIVEAPRSYPVPRWKR